jgi:hypothetical protein
VVYRKGALSNSTIDRDWPHQVALAARMVSGANYATITKFCRDEDLSLCQRGHSFRRNDEDFVVFCFAERNHAERFQHRFGGEFVHPKSRPRVGRR